MLENRLTLFRNRHEAGKQLAQALLPLHLRQPLVLALPRGGVPIGFEIACFFDAPLDILLVRKIAMPSMPEVALGAVVDGNAHQVVWNEGLARTLQLEEADLETLKQQQLQEIERRRQAYQGATLPPSLVGRSVIMVDDGIATGSTMKVALKALRHTKAAALIVAVPVAPPDVWADIAQLVDHGVCLHCPKPFGAVGQYYSDFEQLKDQQIVDLLAKANLSRNKAGETEFD
jgi:putative phosphoribosyl transferase